MSLYDEIQKILPPEMFIPNELEKLFRWIETNGYCKEDERGCIGYLYPNNELMEGWTETERPGGTYIEFFADRNYKDWWFMTEDSKDRLRIFARTGADGSVAAFWLDDDGEQKIVHLGSGSGSVLACVLAETPLDFLRLLAIGYDEICWNNEFNLTPREAFQKAKFAVRPNLKYQNWLVHEFKTTIPKRACEIVKHPAEYGDSDSKDIFCKWLEAVEDL